MQDPEGLYTLAADISDVPRGLPLVAGLTGFADAGAAVSQFTSNLRDALTTMRCLTTARAGPQFTSSKITSPTTGRHP